MSKVSPDENQAHSHSFPERLSFSVAIFLVTLVVISVIYNWNTGDNVPPILSVTTEAEIREIQGQFYVPFTVTNSGSETVEAVQVVGELRLDGEVIEAGEQQIDFLSRRETAAGAFIFTRNPQEGEMVIRVASYKLP